MTARRCPECSAHLTVAAERCWLCGADLSAEGKTASPPGAGTDIQTASTFNLSTLFLVMTLAAVAAGAFAAAPGLGIFFLVVATPALVRTMVITTRQKASGVASTPLEKVVGFLGSVGVVLALLVAIQIALFIACWAGLATGAAFNLFGELPAIIGGVIGGLVTLVALGRVIIKGILTKAQGGRKKP